MLDIEELKEKKITELNKIAQDMNISGFSGLKKSELIFRILEEQTAQEGLIFSKGVLEILSPYQVGIPINSYPWWSSAFKLRNHHEKESLWLVFVNIKLDK